MYLLDIQGCYWMICMCNIHDDDSTGLFYIHPIKPKAKITWDSVKKIKMLVMPSIEVIYIRLQVYPATCIDTAT